MPKNHITAKRSSQQQQWLDIFPVVKGDDIAYTLRKNCAKTDAYKRYFLKKVLVYL